MDEIKPNNLASLLRDFAQGASNSVAGNVAVPVDAIAWLLRKGGVNVPPNPVMGSDWMAEKGLTREPQNKLVGLVGDMAGMVAPFAAAAKAPQIARGLLAAGEAMPEFAASAGRPANYLPKKIDQTGAIVWHGSPHKFAPTPNNPLGEFDFSKIGTGEGAQAYGHGGYMGGAKQTGQTYTGADGYLYKVDLPDEHIAKMLDWDAPLKGKSKKAIDDVVYDYFGGGRTEAIGKKFDEVSKEVSRRSKGHSGSVYNYLADEVGGSPALSESLNKNGVLGIKYLDGGSRVAGKGSSNYVVFPGNERLLKILERNGQSLP